MAMLSSVPIVDKVWDSVDLWLKIVLALAASGVLLAKSVKYVNQGELGLRHLRGRVRKNARPIRPGWAFHVPFVGGVFKKSTLPQTWPLGGVLVPKGGRTWDANYSITFEINPELFYRSWFGHQDPDEYLRTTCTTFLWQVLNDADIDPDRVDHVDVERRVLAQASEPLQLIGVTLLQLHHRWTAETTASQLGSAIKESQPGTGAQVASVISLDGRGPLLSVAEEQ